MRSTIDSGGRVVIPKTLRDRLGLTAGAEMEITERDGVLELRPRPLEVQLVEGPNGVVATADRELPTLDAETVRATLDNVRR